MAHLRENVSFPCTSKPHIQSTAMEEQPAVDPTQNLERKARKQVPGPVTSEKAGEQSSSVNIWSGRRLGPRTDASRKSDKHRQPSQYRCHPATDTGKTRGSEGQISQFCLFFAKGMCYQGPACTYLHRLPTSADNQAMLRNTSQDIFGREKLPDRLDNRKGAGSYDRDMTTLYVNYGGAGHYATPQLRHLLLQNFGEFGPIRSVYIVPAKTIAFVKYHWRASAEFAKEAMDSQTLTGSTMHEVLSVRWANDDPNPVAVIGRKRDALDAAEAAAMAAWDALPPDEKRARLAVMHQAQARKVSAVADRMPEALLQGAAGTLHGSSREQFDEWRGMPAQQQQAEQGEAGTTAVHAAPDGSTISSTDAGSRQQQQQQQGGNESSWSESQWAEYYASHPEEYARWQQYYAWQQQQGWDSGSRQGYADTSSGEPQGAWYEGWRTRHKPQAAGDTQQEPTVAAAGVTAQEAAAVDGADDSKGGVLGLLAGYGSGSESEDDTPAHGREVGAGESGQLQHPEAGQENQQQQQQQFDQQQLQAGQWLPPLSSTDVDTGSAAQQQQGKDLDESVASESMRGGDRDAVAASNI